MRVWLWQCDNSYSIGYLVVSLDGWPMQPQAAPLSLSLFLYHTTFCSRKQRNASTPTVVPLETAQVETPTKSGLFF
eukprot:NODE_2393_length_361_cov_52.299145_g2383_i0.p4 GENE.NODE_2393_length_361_cov_52.299145_g2383_i0~~NODE_2393_length_361_cov_52.299145_g2383_i0.p4  ORF type:complete len:76 (+),score=18.58 NODE_2393_length_361_cov_52.299145_g2383_i0:86-313(+)